mgnify:FL=1
MRITGVLTDAQVTVLRDRTKTAAAANDRIPASVLQAFDGGWWLNVKTDAWDWHEPDGARVHSYARSPGSLDPPSPL